MKNQNYKIDFVTVIILIFGLICGQVVTGGLIFLSETFFGIDVEKSGGLMMLAYVITMIFPILFFDFFVARKSGNRLSFDFSAKPFRVYLLIFPMMFGMMLIADVVTQQIPTTGKFFGKLYEMYQSQMDSLAVNNVVLIIMTVILAPILEEILFRGILLKGMINSNVKPKFAILISAFVFGAIHFYPWQFAGAFLLGLVLGLVYYKTKSLLMPILLHAFNNLLSALFVIYSDSESFSEVFKLKSEYILLAGIVIFAVPFYFFAVKKNIVYNE